MKGPERRVAPAAILLAVVLATGGCTLWTQDSSATGLPSTTEVAQFKKLFMSSWYVESGRIPAGKALTPFVAPQIPAGKATVPVAKLTTVSFASLAPLSFADYPEPGQTTSFTATPVTGTPAAGTGTKVYDITATTTYPAGDLRSNYVEEYYVQDIGLNSSSLNDGSTPDGNWTTADPIVRKDKTTGLWTLGANNWLTQDQTARIRQILTFTDGSTRTESIVSATNAAGSTFDPAAFDINGSLDLAQPFVPSLSTDPKVVYSSVVTYYVSPSTNPNFWFWSGSNAQTILGVRYYTEAVNTAASTYTTYTASFEKTVSILTTAGGTYAGTIPGIFVGSTEDALAESVLRQQIVYGLTGAAGSYAPTGAGAPTTNMQSRVVNLTAGQKDFYLTQLNTEAAALTQANSSLHVPSGAVDSIVAADATTLAFTRNQQVTPAAGTLPFAVKTTDVSGTGPLATIYTSITEGTATATVATAPTSNLMPATGTTGTGAVATFSGAQSMGTLIPASAATTTNSMGSAGTVEAWIYMNAVTDTAGIVHKGTAVDFSDECFSLQGWGSTGQIGIILDKTTGTNSYDSVLSKINLKTKTWYYVVATWDTTQGASSYVRLYINANRTTKGNSGTPSVSAYRQNTSGVLVGSQLPSVYSASYGYFGFSGKITGANVSATALTDAQVTANYNANVSNTANW